MKFFNRVHVLTSTIGTGSLALGLAAAPNMLTLGQAGAANGDITTYVIEQGSDFEIGQGTIGSGGNTLTRTVVLTSKVGSTVSTAKLTLAGSATVRFFPSAESLTEIANRAAAGVAYSNAASGLDATNVQQAIDAVFAAFNGLAPVASTGSYTDLTDLPVITDPVAMAIVFGA